MVNDTPRQPTLHRHTMFDNNELSSEFMTNEDDWDFNTEQNNSDYMMRIRQHNEILEMLESVNRNSVSNGTGISIPCNVVSNYNIVSDNESDSDSDTDEYSNENTPYFVEQSRIPSRVEENVINQPRVLQSLYGTPSHRMNANYIENILSSPTTVGPIMAQIPRMPREANRKRTFEQAFPFES